MSEVEIVNIVAGYKEMENSWLDKGRRAYSLKQYDIAMDCYEKAIAEGDTQAMYLAACMYKSGIGVPKSFCKSKELFRRAADAGYQKARNAMAFYFNTPSVHRKGYVEEACRLRENGKYKEAIEEFLAMTDESFKPDEYTAESMYWIGMMYKWGQGVPKDEVISKEWLEKATDNSSWKAIKELKLDECVPEVICENNCAKATVYIYHNIKEDISKNISTLMELGESFKADIKFNFQGHCVALENLQTMYIRSMIESIFPGGIRPFVWKQGTKLDILAEGEDAKEAVKSIVELFYSRFSEEYLEKLISQEKIKRPISENKKTINTEHKAFDETEFLSQCMHEFADIRKGFNLNEDTLMKAKENPILHRLLAPVIEGCTEHGILKMKKNNRIDCAQYNFDCIESTTPPTVIDDTADMVSSMSRYYCKKCYRLHVKMEKMNLLDEVIRIKD